MSPWPRPGPRHPRSAPETESLLARRIGPRRTMSADRCPTLPSVRKTIFEKVVFHATEAAHPKPRYARVPNPNLVAIGSEGINRLLRRLHLEHALSTSKAVRLAATWLPACSKNRAAPAQLRQLLWSRTIFTIKELEAAGYCGVGSLACMAL